MAKRQDIPAPDLAALADAVSGDRPGGPSDAGTGRRAPVLLGDIGMRIARDGTWFYHGSPITRKPLVKLFSTVLVRENDDSYYLVTPVEKCQVTVDDAPFVAVALEVQGDGHRQSLTLRTNVEDQITVNASHPIRVAFDPETGEPSPYVLVRDRLEALIARPVYYELAEIGIEKEVDGEMLFGVWSEGEFFPLGSLDDEEGGHA